MKRCSRCGELKQLDAFHRARGKPDGRHGHCKECRTTGARRVYPPVGNSKECSRCHETRPLEAFYRKSRNRDGRKAECVACYNAEGDAYRKRPEVRAANLDRRRQRRNADPERHAQQQRASTFRSRYGIELEHYEAMLEQQNHRCAICEHIPVGQVLYVDHCHTTGRVRGLLCRSCNTGIGMLRDNADYLRRAAEYIDQVGPVVWTTSFRNDNVTP